MKILQKIKEHKRALVLFVLAILLLIFLLVIAFQESGYVNSSKHDPFNKDKEDKIIDSSIEKERVDLTAIKNITGKIKTVDVDIIRVITNEEEELMLKIPQERVSFIAQVPQGNGSFIRNEISLKEISADEEVVIQYNGETNEVMLVLVTKVLK